jgi:hypothetical protein
MYTSAAAVPFLLLLLLTASSAQVPPTPTSPYTRWSLGTQDFISASPVINTDGSICVGSWDCSMYCVGTSDDYEGQVKFI